MGEKQQWMRPEGAAPGWSCSPWREAHGGAGGLWELSLRRTCVEHLLEDGPCGTEPCQSSVWRAVACGKPTQDQFWKDGILLQGPHAGAGKRVTMKEWQL